MGGGGSPPGTTGDASDRDMGGSASQTNGL